jgi:CheY-like chemotaxis protein
MLRETTSADDFGRAEEPSGSARVLIAEDNSVNQLILRTLLEELGMSVRMVADGQALIEAWRDGPWDIVLTDIHMPVMDGLAAAKRIRAEEKDQGSRHTPIIAVTADDMPHHTAEYEAAGMNGLVAKPFDLDQLIQTIDSVFGSAETGPGFRNTNSGRPAGSAAPSSRAPRRASR